MKNEIESQNVLKVVHFAMTPAHSGGRENTCVVSTNVGESLVQSQNFNIIF